MKKKITDKESISPSTDVMTLEQRSRCMSKIKGKNTSPEIKLRKALLQVGVRYRLKSTLIGKPDILFISQKIAVFVDGCFWHGCPLHRTYPKNNSLFWSNKIEGNIKRDEIINLKLRNQGWLVLRFWEHEINDGTDRIVQQIKDTLFKQSLPL